MNQKRFGIRRAILVIILAGILYALAPTLKAESIDAQDINVFLPARQGKEVLGEQEIPQYVPGQLLIKLKEGKTLEDIQELNQIYQVYSIEQVFPDLGSPQENLKQLKSALSNLGKSHQRWFWQLDKDSAEYQEYEANIRKEKASLVKQIQETEEFIAHLENRQDRAQTQQGALNLEDIYLLKTDAPVNIELMAQDYRVDLTVVYAEPNYIMQVSAFPDTLPNDTYVDPGQVNTWKKGSWGQAYEDLWGIKKIVSEQAWCNKQGQGIIIAVIDTGVDLLHEDLVDNLWINTREIPGNGIDDDGNGYKDDVNGWDFANNDNNPADGHGHGTHCAGTIAGVGNNAKGVIGVAPQAKIMAVKGLSDGGSGSTVSLAQCIYYAVNNGADVLSNSWGGQGVSQTLSDAFHYAYNNGCVAVAAAGNSNMDFKNFTPANVDTVISVAATDSNDIRASFSNWGAVDVAAPGVDVLSLRAKGTAMGNTLTEKYTRASGTSMACPHTAGVCALMLSKEPHMLVDDLRKVLRVSVDALPANSANTLLSCGRINAKKALEFDSSKFCFAKITDPTTSTLRNKDSVDIKGLAYGSGFAYYVVDYVNLANPTQWQIITPETRVPVSTEASLGILDLRGLTDGSYQVRLRVSNNAVPANVFLSTVNLTLDNVNLMKPEEGRFLNSAGTTEIRGIACGWSFVNYILESCLKGTGRWSSAGILLVDGGRVPKINAGELLGTLDAASLSESGAYELRLTVNYNDARKEVMTKTFYLDKTLKPGWPIRIEGLDPRSWTKANLKASIINAGGEKNVVVSSQDKIFLVSPGGTMLQIPRDLTKAMGAHIAYPLTAVDLDADGQEEILTNIYITCELDAAKRCIGYRFKSDAYKFDGSRVSGWPAYLDKVEGGAYCVGASTPAIGNFMGDNKPEVALNAYVKNLNSVNKQGFYLLNNDGSLPAGWPVVIPSAATSYGVYWSLAECDPAVADLDSDGKDEVVFWNNELGLVAYNAQGLMPGWQMAKIPINIGVWDKVGPVLIAELDNNGKYEIVLPGPGGYLYIFSHNGTLLEALQIEKDPQVTARGILATALADMDKDNKLEIIFAAKINSCVNSRCYSTYKLYIYKFSSGALTQVLAKQIPSVGIDPTMAIVDMNDDGKQEIILPVSYGVTAFNDAGINIWEKRTYYSAGLNVSSPLFADLDQDGYLDLIVYNSAGDVFVWGLTGRALAENMPWPQHQHDSRHTGCFGSIQKPQPKGFSLSATAVSTSQIDLSWEDIFSDEDGFEILRSTDNSNFDLIATLPSNQSSYSDKGLSSGATYYYQAFAYKSTDKIGISPVISTTTLKEPRVILNAPEVKVVAVQPNQIDLSWQDNSENESGFRLYRRKAGSLWWTALRVLPAGSTSYSDKGVRSGATYQYRMRACSSQGRNSPYSKTVSATTPRR
jgi:subtilisin family serine protease